MRLLLFFICFLFSFIFYFFHSLQLWKDVFWKSLTKLHIVPLSWNLLIESSFFMVLGIIFFIYFTPKSNFEFFKNLFKNYSRQIYIFFYVIFFWLLFSGRIFYDSFILFWIIFFLFSDFSFNYLSSLSYFREQKVNLRYFWLFLNYASSFISIYYIYNINFSVSYHSPEALIISGTVLENIMLSSNIDKDLIINCKNEKIQDIVKQLGGFKRKFEFRWKVINWTIAYWILW